MVLRLFFKGIHYPFLLTNSPWQGAVKGQGRELLGVVKREGNVDMKAKLLQLFKCHFSDQLLHWGYIEQQNQQHHSR